MTNISKKKGYLRLTGKKNSSQCASERLILLMSKVIRVISALEFLEIVRNDNMLGIQTLLLYS